MGYEKPSRSYGAISTLRGRLVGQSTLTLGELLTFAAGIIIIFNIGGFIAIPAEWRLIIGLAIILIGETAF